ncbi:MAG: DUF58 domain-containing protein [Candidatus Sericytochromatia bacterium]
MNNRDRIEEALKRGSWIKFPYYFIRYFLTANGRIFLACTALSAPLSFVALNTTAHIFFTNILSLVIVAFIIGMVYIPKVSIKRDLNNLIEAKSLIKYQVFIKNISKRNLYNLKAYDMFWSTFINYQDTGLIEKLEPNQEKIYNCEFIAEKRGIYNSKLLYVNTNYPFGLFNFVKKVELPLKLIVFPNYERLETFDLNIQRKFQLGGISLTSNIGDSTEFMGTREYVYGDNPRFIHPNSWARTGKPIIKEFQEEYFIRLALLIDTFCPQSEYFEKSISFSASIADFLSRSDYIIDIFATGDSFYHFQSGRALAHFENILELLSCIDVTKTKNRDNLFNRTILDLEKHLQNISTVILIFNDWDSNRENLIRYILSYGIGVKAFIFSEKKADISNEFKDIVSQSE